MGAVAFGQGTINFANDGNTLIKYFGQPMPVGGGFVQLLWAPAGTHAEPYSLGSSLTGWFAANPGWQATWSIKSVGPVAGRFIAGTVTVPTATPGAPVQAAVAAWAGNFANFDVAVAAGSLAGVSEAFVVRTGNPTTTPPGVPATITGPGKFRGMDLTIPEPSPAALVLCCLTCGILLRSLTRRLDMRQPSDDSAM